MSVNIVRALPFFRKIARRYLEPKLSKDRQTFKAGPRTMSVVDLHLADLKMSSIDQINYSRHVSYPTIANFFPAILSLYLTETRPKEEDQDEPEIFKTFNAYINLVSTGPADEYMLIRKDTGEWQHEFNCDAMMKQAKIMMGKAFNSKVLEMGHARNEFKIKQPFGLREDKKIKNYFIYNSCKPAAWKALEPTNFPPDFIVEFFRNLFIVDEQRVRVLSWVYLSIHQRSQSCLGLFGGRRIGKTLLAEFIKHLCNYSLCTNTQDGFLESPFNEILWNKALVVFDEVKCDDWEKVSKLRRNLNPRITFEGKNKKPFDDDNHASFVFTANGFNKVMIEADEPRFELPDVILAKKNDEVLRKMYDFIMDKQQINGESFDQVLRNTVEWIKSQRDPKYKVTTPIIKTMTFWKMVLESSPPPIRFVVKKLIADGEELTYKELLKEWDSRKSANWFFPVFEDLKEFIDSYQPHGVPVIHVDSERTTFKKIVDEVVETKEPVESWVL